MKRVKQFLIVGPSAFVIGILAAFVATLAMLGVMHAQPQNIATMYGCQTATLQTCTTLQPVAVDSSGNVKTSISGAYSAASTITFTGGSVLDGAANANVVSLVNGTTAQNFRVYGTTTGSRYLNITHDGSNALLQMGGAGNISFSAGQIFTNDNTNDIGTSGGNRPRAVYAATSVSAGNTLLGSLTHAASGVRFLCIDTNGVIATQSTACVGT